MKGRKDRDDDLILFRDLSKRENEGSNSLLQCVSEEYEHDSTGANGKFSLYRIPSGKKEYGLGFLVDSHKNDYDWLKTPPATPLFPSLEMEPSAQLVVQKEIPISQPLTRFAGNDLEALKHKASDGKANQTNSSKAKLPMRSITPSHSRQRARIVKNTNEQEPAEGTHCTITNKSSTSNGKTEHVAANNTKSSTQKLSNINADFLALNLKKSMEANDQSQRKPKTTRGVSPSLRSRVAAHIVELSNEAPPPNLRTDQRSTSTTRGRSSSNLRRDNRSDSTPRACRPSRSPSPSVSKNNGYWNQLDTTQKNLRTQKERFTPAAGSNESRAHFIGSKMVEKVVNARKSSINQAERETKPKPPKYRV